MPNIVGELWRGSLSITGPKADFGQEYDYFILSNANGNLVNNINEYNTRNKPYGILLESIDDFDALTNKSN